MVSVQSAPTAQEARSQSSTNIVPYQSFGALLGTSHFIVTAFFLTGATFGISYGITYSSVRNSPLQWVLFDSSEIINLCLTCFFMTLVMFVVVLHMARKRIVFGVQRPLAHAAYKSNWFKKIALYPLGVNDWRRRIILIIVQSFVFPTAFIIAGLAIGCHAMKERHERQSDDDGISLPSIYSEICFITSLHAYLAIGSSYRAFVVLTIYIYNYLSAYNDAQPEIVEMRAAAVTTAISAAISENAAMYATNVNTGTSATHTNGGFIDSSGRHSYPNIPTGQVLYAIPVEMNTIPPPGTAPTGNSHTSQQGHSSANRTGGDGFSSQQPPPYVTNQFAQYHGNAQHREEGDTASAYGYGYGGYGQGAGNGGRAREQEPEGMALDPQRRLSVEFYASSHGVPSDRVPTQPQAPTFLFDMPLASATDTTTICKVEDDNAVVKGVLGGEQTTKSNDLHAEGEDRIAPDVSPAAAFTPREPEDDEVGVAHAAGLGQDRSLHEISRNNHNNDNGGVFANFEILETDGATSASHSLNNRQKGAREVDPGLGLNATGPSPSPPMTNPFE